MQGGKNGRKEGWDRKGPDSLLRLVAGRDPCDDDLLPLVFLPLGDKCLKNGNADVSKDSEQASA